MRWRGKRLAKDLLGLASTPELGIRRLERPSEHCSGQTAKYRALRPSRRRVIWRRPEPPPGRIACRRTSGDFVANHRGMSPAPLSCRWDFGGGMWRHNKGSTAATTAAAAARRQHPRQRRPVRRRRAVHQRRWRPPPDHPGRGTAHGQDPNTRTCMSARRVSPSTCRSVRRMEHQPGHHRQRDRHVASYPTSGPSGTP